MNDTTIVQEVIVDTLKVVLNPELNLAEQKESLLRVASEAVIKLRSLNND